MAPGIVTVQVYQNEIDAGLARSILESNGIPAFLVGASLANVYGGIGVLGRINLLVPEERLNDALAILEHSHSDEAEGDVDDQGSRMPGDESDESGESGDTDESDDTGEDKEKGQGA